MSGEDRIQALRALAERRPTDPRPLFGLAAEYERSGDAAGAAEMLRRYLAIAEDEGNAWGRLGAALRELGDDDAARAAYQRGVVEARRHGHPTMAAEFEEILEEWQ
jgi:Flp pilus assembly protein TadD